MTKHLERLLDWLELRAYLRDVRREQRRRRRDARRRA